MLNNEKSVKKKERRKQDVQICVWGESSQYAHMHVAQCHNKIIRGCEKSMGHRSRQQDGYWNYDEDDSVVAATCSRWFRSLA